jgi:hypothetical protein
MRPESLRSSTGYRLQQLAAALRACIDDAERELVRQQLTVPERALFFAMPRYDQRHCLDVYQTLVASGERDVYVLRAALYHDCGKVDDNGRSMSLLWYGVATMLKRVPALYIAFARRDTGPFRPLYVYAEHARRGAKLAAHAGAPLEIVATIRHYHDPAPQGRAARLQWADQQH